MCPWHAMMMDSVEEFFAGQHPFVRAQASKPSFLKQGVAAATFKAIVLPALAAQESMDFSTHPDFFSDGVRTGFLVPATVRIVDVGMHVYHYKTKRHGRSSCVLCGETAEPKMVVWFPDKQRDEVRWVQAFNSLIPFPREQPSVGVSHLRPVAQPAVVSRSDPYPLRALASAPPADVSHKYTQ